eukprot:GHRQ01013820.1.p1 GENE.GHRQ01013820.1~~GHRQ01013820.1.p1  ORF type:complete len:240 (+),score=72.01 GHRQ01013820.1:541-1260(+)
MCGNGDRPNASGGTTCSSCQAQHSASNRYRCSLCSNSFCSGCRTVPYHAGLSCREAAAPCCPCCDVRVPDAAGAVTRGMSVRQLRDAASSLGADCSWCLERGELVSVYQRAVQVCSRAAMMAVTKLHYGKNSGSRECWTDCNCSVACQRPLSGVGCMEVCQLQAGLWQQQGCAKLLVAVLHTWCVTWLLLTPVLLLLLPAGVQQQGLQVAAVSAVHAPAALRALLLRRQGLQPVPALPG